MLFLKGCTVSKLHVVIGSLYQGSGQATRLSHMSSAHFDWTQANTVRDPQESSSSSAAMSMHSLRVWTSSSLSATSSSATMLTPGTGGAGAPTGGSSIPAGSSAVGPSTGFSTQPTLSGSPGAAGPASTAPGSSSGTSAVNSGVHQQPTVNGAIAGTRNGTHATTQQTSAMGVPGLPSASG
jgi:hypothetical protein